jgi:glycosylphosphatidylinositol transamidase
MVSLLCKFTLNLCESITDNRKASSVLLRRHPIILKLPPYLSFLCIVIGVAWLLVLPLNNYSRRTYISENALLPAQVHTYFAGSDQNVFRGFKREVDALEERSNIEYGSLLQYIGMRF